MIKVKLSNWKSDHQMDEAYKALRTNIQFCGADKKVIALTSCTPNEERAVWHLILLPLLLRAANLCF